MKRLLITVAVFLLMLNNLNAEPQVTYTRTFLNVYIIGGVNLYSFNDTKRFQVETVFETTTQYYYMHPYYDYDSLSYWTISWGDGSLEFIPSSEMHFLSHDYEEPGAYQISIGCDYPNLSEPPGNVCNRQKVLVGRDPIPITLDYQYVWGERDNCDETFFLEVSNIPTDLKEIVVSIPGQYGYSTHKVDGFGVARTSVRCLGSSNSLKYIVGDSEADGHRILWSDKNAYIVTNPNAVYLGSVGLDVPIVKNRRPLEYLNTSLDEWNLRTIGWNKNDIVFLRGTDEIGTLMVSESTPHSPMEYPVEVVKQKISSLQLPMNRISSFAIESERWDPEILIETTDELGEKIYWMAAYMHDTNEIATRYKIDWYNLPFPKDAISLHFPASIFPGYFTRSSIGLPWNGSMYILSHMKTHPDSQTKYSIYQTRTNMSYLGLVSKDFVIWQSQMSNGKWLTKGVVDDNLLYPEDIESQLGILGNDVDFVMPPIMRGEDPSSLPQDLMRENYFYYISRESPEDDYDIYLADLVLGKSYEFQDSEDVLDILHSTQSPDLDANDWNGDGIIDAADYIFSRINLEERY